MALDRRGGLARARLRPLARLQGIGRTFEGRARATRVAWGTMIQPGTTAPAFTRNDHLGRPLDMAALRGKSHLLVLFYPLDFTPT